MTKVKVTLFLEFDEPLEDDQLKEVTHEVGEGLNMYGLDPKVIKAKIVEDEVVDTENGKFKHAVSLWFGTYEQIGVPSRIVDLDSNEELTDREAIMQALKKVGTYPRTYTANVKRNYLPKKK